ncbi:MAG: hypothetical protein R3313_05295, partial [Candidatus Saccharimonadales bacterium]|nr:hypothetical protein [Candidatus Saccharimonadales bacterium]
MDFILVAMVIILISGGSFVEYNRRKRKPTLKGSSVVLGYYTEGAILAPVKHGEMNGMHYSVFLAGLNMIIRAELPFRTKLHLLGIPTHSGAVQLDPGGEEGAMEKVTLEGDFPNYFTLYADNDQQAEARYVFPPDTMQYVVDFCQSHTWEIVHDELYFIQDVTVRVE